MCQLSQPSAQDLHTWARAIAIAPDRATYGELHHALDHFDATGDRTAVDERCRQSLICELALRNLSIREALTRPCEECGVSPGEPCHPSCTAASEQIGA